MPASVGIRLLQQFAKYCVWRNPRRPALGNLKLVEYDENDVPQYAILSHTWGADGDEVTFKDFLEGDMKEKAGYQKLVFCSKQAARDRLQHFWIDTCCIDKSSSAELTEAINSMFHWYQRASKCYVYLSDVSNPEHSSWISQSPPGWEAALRRSRWFTRGWTLQELIAPELVEFFSQDGSYIGSKISLEQPIHEITGISSEILRGGPLAGVEVEERLSWAKHRETKRPEDKAYSLCGIFNIRMSLFYGEGRDEAFDRLRRKIGKSLKPLRESLEIMPSPPRSLICSTTADQLSHEPRCLGWCSCRCHRILNVKSPQLLSSSVGDFSIRFGAERSGCNESNCKRRNKSTTVVTYRFPKWLTNSALHLSLTSTALSVQSNLKTLRIIPDSAEIFGAVSAGDLGAMQKLFGLGKASIHDVDEHNWTLLHRALLLQKEGICRFLLTQGADAYVEADNGSSVVERAWFHAQSNAKSFTESVIYDSDVLTQVDLYEFVQSQQYTPIHKIILGLSKLQLSQYLETSTDGINASDASGYTPLFWASVKGNNAAVQLLLHYGAVPSMAGRIRQTPLHIARTSQVVRSLLDYSADTEARDTSGRTPLHSYSYRQIASAPSVIEEIVAGGAYINAKTTAGHTALHYAAAFGNTHLIPVLFENGISLDETKNSGDTSLALAVRHNQVDAIRLLLQCSANVALQNEQGESVIHIGARFGRVATLETLATCDLTGISLTTKDTRGFSPLDYFENRQDRSLELESAFAKLVACFPAPGDEQNGVIGSVQLYDITGLDKVRSMPGAF